MVEILETMAIPADGDESRMSRSPDEGIVGEHTRVTRVDDGVQFTMGGVQVFGPLSAEVTEAGRDELRQLATLLAGRRNIILIRGHAAAIYLPEGAAWSDLDALSFARARAVHQLLVEEGLDDRVFRLEAVGAREPLESQAMTEQELARNRRVDIILMERMSDAPNQGMGVAETVASLGEQDNE
jgi:flagellar motor protein MotB